MLFSFAEQLNSLPFLDVKQSKWVCERFLSLVELRYAVMCSVYSTLWSAYINELLNKMGVCTYRFITFSPRNQISVFLKLKSLISHFFLFSFFFSPAALLLPFLASAIKRFGQTLDLNWDLDGFKSVEWWYFISARNPFIKINLALWCSSVCHQKKQSKSYQIYSCCVI